MDKKSKQEEKTKYERTNERGDITVRRCIVLLVVVSI